MKSQVQKWGNSLAVRIPKAFAAEIGLQQNSTVDVSVSEGALVVKAMRAPKYSLDDMLERVSDSNIHAECDWGTPVGGEVW